MLCLVTVSPDSYPRSRLITWRRPEVKFGRNVMKRNNKKLPRWGQNVRNKYRINSQIKKTHLKRIPNKDNLFSQLFTRVIVFVNQSTHTHTNTHTYIYIIGRSTKRFKKYKSLREPSYFKYILILSLDLQQPSLYIYIYIYIYIKEK